MTTSNNVPRMRTIPDAVELLHDLDENSAITVRAVRRLVAEGALPVVMVGNKRLVNFDRLLQVLSGSVAHVPEPLSGSIRRIDERVL